MFWKWFPDYYLGLFGPNIVLPFRFGFLLPSAFCSIISYEGNFSGRLEWQFFEQVTPEVQET